MNRINVPTMTVGIWSDMLYPIYQQRQINEMLDERGVPNEYLEINSPHGHDAFLINGDQLAGPLEQFLSDVSKSASSIDR